MIVFSHGGLNAVGIEVAMESRRRGLRVVAVTSMDNQRRRGATHSSGNRLSDVADVVIDNCVPARDSVLGKFRRSRESARFSLRRHVSILLLALPLLSCGSIQPVAETGFLSRSALMDGTTYRYVVWVPPEARLARELPVVLFLHGAGERGSDGWRQTAVGLGSAIRWNPERFPMIVVMPQAPAETRWLGAEARFAMEALERSVEEFNGDPRRLYLTGLSLGGYGSWHLALENPGRFAAVVPVCGGIVKPDTAESVQQSPLTRDADDPYAFTAARVRHLPIWIFHGAEDPIIPASESRLMFEALEREGADVRYREYAGVGHGVWDQAYGEPELWNWLLEQRRME